MPSDENQAALDELITIRALADAGAFLRMGDAARGAHLRMVSLI